MSLPRLFALLGASLLPVAVAAQGIGDVASRERAKRDKEARAGESRPTYSNEDLDRGKPPKDKKDAEKDKNKGKSGTTSAPASPTLAPYDEANSASAVAARREQERQRAQEAAQSRDRQVAGIEARIQALQSKLNPMSGSFIYGATGSNSANEEAEVRSELQRLEGELARARAATPEPGAGGEPRPTPPGRGEGGERSEGREGREGGEGRGDRVPN